MNSIETNIQFTQTNNPHEYSTKKTLSYKNNNKNKYSKSQPSLNENNFHKPDEYYHNENIKPNIKYILHNHKFPYYSDRNFYNTYYNIREKNKGSKMLERELKKLKSNYISTNNDNIIYQEDIEQLAKMNKKLEAELINERNHNYELAKQNDKLYNDNIHIYHQIEKINQKIMEIKLHSQKDKEIIDTQNLYEEQLNEKVNECNKILENNNNLDLEYKILNDKYIRLKAKNAEDENELNQLKQEQEKKFTDIENKLSSLINELNKLKNENNQLSTDNENLKINIMNFDRDKNDYYNKYQEQKIENDKIQKEIYETKYFCQKYKKNFGKEEEKNMVNNIVTKNISENKIKVIKELQKKINEYRFRRKSKDNDI